MNNNGDIRVLTKKIKKMSYRVLINAILIAIIGTFSVYSATYTKTLGFLNRGIMWFIIGVIVYFILPLVRFLSVISKY